jgi:hypothetical protein
MSPGVPGGAVGCQEGPYRAAPALGRPGVRIEDGAAGHPLHLRDECHGLHLGLPVRWTCPAVRAALIDRSIRFEADELTCEPDEDPDSSDSLVTVRHTD